MVIRFEELLSNTDKILYQLIKFLNLKPNSNLINCALENKLGIYKRISQLLPFDPFSQIVVNSSLRQIVEKKRKAVYKIVDDYLLHHPNVESFLND